MRGGRPGWVVAVLALSCASGTGESGGEATSPGDETSTPTVTITASTTESTSTSTASTTIGSTTTADSTGTDDTGTDTQTSFDPSDTDDPAGCGDGEPGPGEECDDGNRTNADGCNNDCRTSAQLLWSTTIPGGLNEVDQGWDVAVDPSGDFFVVGQIEGEADDGWFRKYSAIGGMLWTQTHAGPGGSNDQFRSVLTDADGNVYVGGYESTTAGANAYLRKMDGAGTEIWLDTYNGPGDGTDLFNSVRFDDNGDLLVAGRHATATESEIMIRKYSIDGDILWTRFFDGPAVDTDSGLDIVPTAGGSFYVTGWIATAEMRNAWVGRYDTDGNLLWERSHNGPDSLDDYYYDGAPADNGGVYVCGYENATAISWHMFVREYDSDGEIVWTERYDGETDEGAHCFGIDRDSDGNLVAVGGEIVDGIRNILVRKYAPDGTELWTNRIPGGGPGPDFGRNVSFGDEDLIYVAGGADVNTDVRDIWIGVLTP